MRLFALSSLCAVGVISTAASAELSTFRDWVDIHGLSTNLPSQEWYGTTGINGPLMTGTGDAWKSLDQPYTWPMIGPIVNPGEYGGAAGPATFAGLWGRPGPNLPAVLVYSPNSTVWVHGMTVHSELIANGMLGDGVTITVLADIGGVVSDLGTVTLAHTTEARLDLFALADFTALNPGDSISIIFGNNGSFLYDHVNFNAWVTAPGPGGIALLAVAGLAGGRRRRR